MKGRYTTREAAKKLGRTVVTIQRHIAAGTIDAPQLLTVGTVQVRMWSDRDIEKVRKVLSRLRPGPKPKQK
jgi:predicted transcriptional regulator